MTRRAPLIIVASALLLTVAFWYLLYQPRNAEQARYVRQTAELEGERGELQAQIAWLRDVEANAEDYRSQVTRLTEYIPDAPAQPEALGELQRVADESGVTINELTFAEPEAVADAPPTGADDRTLTRIPTLLTVEGGFFQVVDLLRRIEVDLTRALKIDTVTMDEAEDSFPRLTVTLNGHIFAVLPLAEVVTADGQPAQPATASEGASEAPSEGTSAPDQPSEGAAPASGAAPDGTTDAGTS
jgi:Tfp pilus assembly protein PilO